MWLSAQVIPASLSAAILAILIIMLAGSLAVFSLLARRITERHRELALSRWMAQREAKLIEHPWADATAGLVEKLELLKPFHPRGRLVFDSSRWTLAELITDSSPKAKGKIPRWRILAWQLDDSNSPWPATGLRPASHAVSLLDLFDVSSYPSLLDPEQFMIFGSDSAAARRLAESDVARLLPPDVGLLLLGRVLLLDFSPRPFQADEFEMLLELARRLTDQIAGHTKISSRI